jgi:hypothetical protein
MGKLKALAPRLQVLDTRRVRPSPKRADPELLTPEHRAWRLIVIDRAGGRCEWVENGIRCNSDRNVVADHIIERADGGAHYDPANGQCLCTSHNTKKGLLARQARMARLGD